MIKHIVVHLTGSPEDDVRISHAEAIARTFDAHLTGLQAHILPQLVTTADPTSAVVMQEMMTQSEDEAKAINSALKPKIDRLGISSELRQLSYYNFAIGEALAAATRTADLFIGTRPYGDPTGQQRIEETVLFRSGRGCLFAPPQVKAPKSFSTILVAWKETREAARAVAEAMPFLRRAQQVHVAIVEEEGASEQYHLESGANIGRYLSRHGVSCEVRKIAGWSNTGDALANEVAQTGTSLVVMGGYGHSRFREWALGGVTRKFLAEATTPVLMAH
jgi:nucleotide-binding universal stress UspA family protein